MVVQDASHGDGANVFQYDYSEGGNTNDDWFLIPADDRIVGVIRLFASSQGTHSIQLARGHSFLSIQNTYSCNIPLGGITIPPGVEMTVGTWEKGFAGHCGVQYNYETYLSASDHDDYVNTPIFLYGSDLFQLNSHLLNNDTWSVTNNCAAFSLSIWFALKDGYFLEAGLPPMPVVLEASIIQGKKSYEKGRYLQRVTPFGYVENDVFIDYTEIFLNNHS